MTRSMAVGLASFGIRVHAVCPGATQTNMFVEAVPDQEDRDKLAAQVPLGRVGKPEDVARAVLSIFMKYLGLVNEELRIAPLPFIGLETSLQAEVRKGCFSVPALFPGHVWKKCSAPLASEEDNTVPPCFELFDRLYGRYLREVDGYLDTDVLQLISG